MEPTSGKPAYKTMSKHERARLWATVYGLAAFEKAELACGQLLKICPDNHHPLFVPLATAVHVVYSRPFCSMYGIPSEAKFDKADVPEDLQGMHDFLLEVRHKMIAHTDATVSSMLGFNFHDVEFERASNGLHFSCCDPTISREAYVECGRLITTMKLQAMRRFLAIKPQLEGILPPALGRYTLNLQGDDAFSPAA